MKKSTLVVLLLAAALGGYVYYSEFRHPSEKSVEGASTPLYTFANDEVTSIRVARAGESAPIVLEHRADGWTLTSPVEARADQSNADSLANALAHVASSRSLPADPARMKEFGLSPPAASVEMKLKKGESQKLELGAKDFTGMDVYAQKGGGKDVLLVPDSVLTEATRPVVEFRDRALLDIHGWGITEMDFRTAKAKFKFEKKDTNWNMIEPRGWPADSDEVTQLTSSLSNAKFIDVVEEQAKGAATEAKYGLNAPLLTIHLRNDQSGEATLLVGKKDENKYFARDAGRSLVFHLEESLVKKFLDETFQTLCNKYVLRSQAGEFAQLTIRNEKQTIKANQTAEGKWEVLEPADLKGKILAPWHVFEPLNSSKATEILDHPPASVLAKLAKPAVEIKLTDKKGAVTTIEVSAKDDTSVYARTSASPTVYKLDAYFLTQLNFVGSQAVQ